MLVGCPIVHKHTTYIQYKFMQICMYLLGGLEFAGVPPHAHVWVSVIRKRVKSTSLQEIILGQKNLTSTARMHGAREPCRPYRLHVSDSRSGKQQ